MSQVKITQAVRANESRPLTQPSEKAEGGLAVDATQEHEEWRFMLDYAFAELDLA